MTAWPTPASIFRSYHHADGEEPQHQAWGDFGSNWTLPDPSTMFSTTNNGAGPSKARGLSLDSAHLEDFNFTASTKSNLNLPARSRTTLLRPKPELPGLWETDRHMEIDEASPPESPRSNALLLPLEEFDAELSIDDAFGVCQGSSSTDDTPDSLSGLFEGASGFSPIQELVELQMDDVSF